MPTAAVAVRPELIVPRLHLPASGAVVALRRESLPVASAGVRPGRIASRLCLHASTATAARRRKPVPNVSRARGRICARGDIPISLGSTEPLGWRGWAVSVRPRLIATCTISLKAVPASTVLVRLRVWPGDVAAEGLVSSTPLLLCLADRTVIATRVLHAGIVDHALLSRGLLTKRSLADGGAILRKEMLPVSVRCTGDLRRNMRLNAAQTPARRNRGNLSCHEAGPLELLASHPTLESATAVTELVASDRCHAGSDTSVVSESTYV